ncbi:MAG: metal-dependent hydrolase [Azonexus sp.]
MPTILTHLAPPLALRLGLGEPAVSRRLLAAGLLAAILPDLDVLAFRLHIPYAHVLGHRGFSHALFFALLLALLAMAGASLLRSSRRQAFGFVGLAAASHPLLDMITNGGLGVALWWPWSTGRVFAPWRVIEVSPLSLQRLLGPRGLAVLQSELLWVWLPALLAGLALLLLRRIAGPAVAPDELERRLGHRPSGLLLLTIAGLWLALCLAWPEPTENAYFARRLWEFSALLLPALFALGGALLQKPRASCTPPSALRRGLLGLAVGLCLTLAYLMGVAVLAEIGRLWARLAYEGSTSLSLDTALFIAPLWAAFAAASYALRRWAPLGGRGEFLSRATLALILFSSLLPALYLLSISSHIHFRS